MSKQSLRVVIAGGREEERQGEEVERAHELKQFSVRVIYLEAVIGTLNTPTGRSTYVHRLQPVASIRDWGIEKKKPDVS